MDVVNALVVGPSGLVGHGIMVAFERHGWQIFGKVKTVSTENSTILSEASAGTL